MDLASNKANTPIQYTGNFAGSLLTLQKALACSHRVKSKHSLLLSSQLNISCSGKKKNIIFKINKGVNIFQELYKEDSAYLGGRYGFIDHSEVIVGYEVAVTSLGVMHKVPTTLWGHSSIYLDIKHSWHGEYQRSFGGYFSLSVTNKRMMSRAVWKLYGNAD